MKKTIYFSDIMGTIIGSEKNIEEDYDKFNELLKIIKEKDGSDEIIFSLISTDSEEAVRSVQNTIRPYIDDTVTFGRQYFDKGFYTDDSEVIDKVTSKANHILDYLNLLLDGNDEIVSIYYADDVEMFHVMLNHLIDKGLADRLHCIVPVRNAGLSETNQLLEDDLKKTNENAYV